MSILKDKFLHQLQTISKLEMMDKMTPLLYGEDALLLKLFLNEVSTPKSVADVLNITKGRVTAMINSLRKKMLIEVKPNVLDGRSIELVLTAEGLSYIQRKLKYVDIYFETFLDYIGETDSKILVDLLDVLLDKIKSFEVKMHG